MNEQLMEFLRRSEVAKLPKEKRRIYQFIVEKEDSLAEEAVTVEEFKNLIVKSSPIDSAVAHFHLPYETIVNLLMEIEAELDKKIYIRSKQVKWIDFTNHSLIKTGNSRNEKLFLFIN